MREQRKVLTLALLEVLREPVKLVQPGLASATRLQLAAVLPGLAMPVLLVALGLTRLLLLLRRRVHLQCQ